VFWAGEEATMPGRNHSAEQIICKLREAEVELAKGHSIKVVCKKLGVTEIRI
jgi:hypothetical protein